MNFRRIPFQFSATNPVERQSELMRRFGVGDDKKVDEAVSSASSGSTSPRLQCRLPKSFAEKETMRFEADNVDSAEWQPRVRVIPIQVEGQKDDKVGQKPSDHHEAPQATPSLKQDRRNPLSNVPVASPISHGIGGSKDSSDTSLRRTHSIPVVVENKGDKKMKSSSCINVPVQKGSDESKSSKPGNGSCASKSKTPKRNQICVHLGQQSLLQITAILNDFEGIKCAVDNFSGLQNDREYYYWDEMMTRTMLKLDGIETYGNEEVRKARKAAIKTVQDTINYLESKAAKPQEGASEAEPMDSQTDLIREVQSEQMDVGISKEASPVAPMAAPLAIEFTTSRRDNRQEPSESNKVFKSAVEPVGMITQGTDKDSHSGIDKQINNSQDASIETGTSRSLEVDNSEIIV